MCVCWFVLFFVVVCWKNFGSLFYITPKNTNWKWKSSHRKIYSIVCIQHTLSVASTHREWLQEYDEKSRKNRTKNFCLMWKIHHPKQHCKQSDATQWTEQCILTKRWIRFAHSSSLCALTDVEKKKKFFRSYIWEPHLSGNLSHSTALPLLFLLLLLYTVVPVYHSKLAYELVGVRKISSESTVPTNDTDSQPN